MPPFPELPKNVDVVFKSCSQCQLGTTANVFHPFYPFAVIGCVFLKLPCPFLHAWGPVRPRGLNWVQYLNKETAAEPVWRRCPQ